VPAGLRGGSSSDDRSADPGAGERESDGPVRHDAPDVRNVGRPTVPGTPGRETSDGGGGSDRERSTSTTTSTTTSSTGGLRGGRKLDLSRAKDAAKKADESEE
jgi:hypothetical protein